MTGARLGQGQPLRDAHTGLAAVRSHYVVARGSNLHPLPPIRRQDREGLLVGLKTVGSDPGRPPSEARSIGRDQIATHMLGDQLVAAD
jgi:hypothetical protein